MTSSSEVQGQTIDDGVHLDLAEDILKALFNDDMPSASRLVLRGWRWLLTMVYVEDDKKVLCQILERVYLPETVDDDKIRTLKLLVHNVFTVRVLSSPRVPFRPLTRPQRRPIRDVSARNALTKFDASISKKYADKLAGFSEEEYRRLEQLEALFAFLDDIVPLDDGEEVEMPMRTRGRKRCVRGVYVFDSRTVVH
jgi:condensin complex subunit 3